MLREVQSCQSRVSSLALRVPIVRGLACYQACKRSISDYVYTRVIARNECLKLNRQAAQSVEPICVRVNDAARMIGVGGTKLYELISSGELETVKIGKATRITTASLQNLVERRRAMN